MYLVNGDCTIWLDREGFSHLDEFLKGDICSRRIFVLVDPNTRKHCWPLVEPYFKEIDVTFIEIPEGEIHKNLKTACYIWDTLLEHKAGRSAILINLGGGVVCDMGGFAASVYKRGIDFINIPTTLLAQVDASVGGKNGIDYAGLKNMIGTFNNPLAVFINDDFLQTLEHRQILSGFAEALKHALVDNCGYWKYLKTFDFKNYDRLIFKSIEIKRNIVAGDYHENNERKKLNFGHTVGHAIESYFLEHGSANVLHGEAVAAGMLCESYISYKMGLIPEDREEEINAVIGKFFPKLPVQSDQINALIQLMSHDKKVQDCGKNFTLIEEIGTARIGQDVSNQLIKDSLQYYIDLPVS